LSDAQKKQEERTNQFLAKMARVAEDRKERDPETAKELQEAREHASNQNLAGQMKDAAEQLQQNQLGKAKESQKATIAGLKQLLKDLEERREAELERLAKKSRETEKELNQLFDEQERLKKKMKEAEAITDPKQREEALKTLHRQQAELQKQAQDLLQRLTRDRGNSRTRQALGKAAEQMEQAAQRLSRGEKADEAMEDTLDRLDEARAEAEQGTDRAENELEREQRARVADLLKRLKERQEALTAESVRVQQRIRRAKEANDNREPLRPAWVSLRDTARNQKELAEEVADAGKNELTGVPVFARLVQRSSESMQQAGERLESLKAKDPRPQDLPDAEAAAIQARAVRRLEQVIESLKDENAGGKLTKQQGGGGGSGGSGGAGDDSLPASAQLKVLRKLQADVNQRTAAFVRDHPDTKNIDEKAKTEFQSIVRDQKDVAELLEQLQNGPEPEAPEGKKP
jgi:hypothetical protein